LFLLNKKVLSDSIPKYTTIGNETEVYVRQSNLLTIHVHDEAGDALYSPTVN